MVQKRDDFPSWDDPPWHHAYVDMPRRTPQAGNWAHTTRMQHPVRIHAIFQLSPIGAVEPIRTRFCDDGYRMVNLDFFDGSKRQIGHDHREHGAKKTAMSNQQNIPAGKLLLQAFDKWNEASLNIQMALATSDARFPITA